MTTTSEIAYQQAEQSVANQRQALSDLRGRGATVLSVAALVASFLGAQAFNGPPNPAATTSSVTTTTPEITTATTHSSGTELNESAKLEAANGIETTTTHGGVATTRLTTTTTTTTAAGKPSSLGSELNIWGWFALGSFVLGALLAVVILWPYKFRKTHNDADELVQQYVDEQGWTPEAMQRDLALFDESTYRTYGRKLGFLYWCFRGASALLAAQVILWIIDLQTR